MFTRERLADIEPQLIDELVEDTLPCVGVAILAGPSGAGKTFFATELACRVSRGEKLCGRETKSAGVAYIAAEDPDGVRMRLTAWKRTNGSEGSLQLVPQAPNLRDLASVADLRKALDEMNLDFVQEGHDWGLGLVLIDTFARATPGADQNSSSDMSAAIAAASSLAIDLQVLVLLIAHTGKDEGRGVAGWYGQYAAADAVLMASGDQDGIRVVTAAKVKNGASGGRFAFRLREVPVAVTSRGKEKTSCVVEFTAPPARAPTAKRAPKLGPSETIALRAILQISDADDAPRIPTSCGAKAGTRGAAERVARELAYSIGLAKESEKPNSTYQRWRRAIEALVAADKIRCAAGLIWPLAGSDRQ